MKITAIILAHYKQRINNIKRIIDDLLDGSVKPDEIIVFIDSDFDFKDDRVKVIRSEKEFLPNIRFAIGSVLDTDYCFFIDDDLTVRKDTLKKFKFFAEKYPKNIFGFEGSILGRTENPYADDESVNRGNRTVDVEIIIRTYFAPTKSLAAGLQLKSMYPKLPKKSLDDVYLCMGNIILNKSKNTVISVTPTTGLKELDPAGVGQSTSGEHYENRNKVCKFLMEKYETIFY